MGSVPTWGYTGCMADTIPTPPDDLGISGSEVWYHLLSNRTLGAVHLALIHNCCRIVDRLDELSSEIGGRLVTTNDVGDEVANPLLTEHRQQLLALRQVLKDLGLMALPEEKAKEKSKLDMWLENKGVEL